MNSNPLNSLTAISPVDGRYRNTTGKLADYFSEQALIRYRIRVEVEYFIALCELPLPQLADIDHTKFAALRALYLDFAPADAERVKEIESVTNHDVKAIEYIIKEKMDSLGLGAYKEFVHFGLTSQDINNTAIPLSLKEAMAGFYYPAVEEVRDKLAAFADEWRDVPMLARTHGQPVFCAEIPLDLWFSRYFSSCHPYYLHRLQILYTLYLIIYYITCFRVARLFSAVSKK